MAIMQAMAGTTISNGPITTYTLTPFFSGGPESVNEGSGLNFTVGGTNITDGTYYWTIQTNSGDFSTTSGNVSVISNSGTFTVTPTADTTTEVSAETFTVALRSGSISGTILATSTAVTINDTSQTAPVPPLSLQFNYGQQDYLFTPASADWNLGTTWTIEFWIKANSTADGSTNMFGGIWGLLNQGGWATTNSINIALSDSKLVFLSGSGANDDVRYTEPTPSKWTHVAIVNDAGTQKVYYNGAEQTKVSGTFGSANYTNTTANLYIGALGNVSASSHFDGKLALVRISNAVKYATTFTPTVTYSADADTKLFLGSDTPLVDISTYELNGVTTSASNSGAVYIPKSTYPNLNNQVKLGDTLENADTSASAVVTSAVYTADPDNWGVDYSPAILTAIFTVNFSGVRHTVTNNGVTVSENFVNRYTALHSASNGGSSAVFIDSNPTNDVWAGSVPVGALIISQVSGRFIVASVSNPTTPSNLGKWVFNVSIAVSTFTAGETHTFIW